MGALNDLGEEELVMDVQVEETGTFYRKTL